ncbi:electron transfer flavoprotein-ubiquinone oxidoreductase [Alteromonadaceae bacterium BrNp21-10]|nr:electron transfer flavoprotein-ubiquinone oxidoreductase [Alteromonadaceae bacterium BrNp21-10]
MQRESMDFDVVIVGAGPAGLSSACRLMQLAKQQQQELTVCVVEKAAEIGGHILSGAVFETRALDELFPEWQQMQAPVTTKVNQDHIYYLNNDSKSVRIPALFSPNTMHNEGNYIVSMGNLCRWLAQQAEGLGAEIFPGFSAAETLFNEDGSVGGVITGDMGLDAEGKPKDGYIPGMELRAKYTIFAEGCRGHLAKSLISQFSLDKDASPQHYAIGFKEIWDVPAEQHQQGLVVHSAGWPLSDKHGEASGGGYLYHAENNQIWVGLIVDLNYSNPHLSPFDEFQRLKHHPIYAQYLQGGKRVSYGARAIAKGGINALPKMTMPGGILVGCDAGTLNFSKIKGNHTAMKSGILAAETIFSAVNSNNQHTDLIEFAEGFKQSWIYDELYRGRNFGAAIHRFGTVLGGAYNTLDQNLFAGKLPFTLTDKDQDHASLTLASAAAVIHYPAPDNKLSFDKLSSVFVSNTNHEENQPCHLKLSNPHIPIEVNLTQFAEPAQRYCPAGVYEFVDNAQGEQVFQINGQNCIHCKTCDIKDPSQNIQWVTPEGGGGPNYPNM